MKPCLSLSIYWINLYRHKQQVFSLPDFDSESYSTFQNHNFAYELGLMYFFKKNWVESNFASNQTPPLSGLPMGGGPNSTSKAPNSESGWCFKFRAENCGISIGHICYPIELKIGVLPI
jgi:hypothetical protein